LSEHSTFIVELSKVKFSVWTLLWMLRKWVKTLNLIVSPLKFLLPCQKIDFQFLYQPDSLVTMGVLKSEFLTLSTGISIREAFCSGSKEISQWNYTAEG